MKEKKITPKITLNAKGEIALELSIKLIMTYLFKIEN